jgi:hypothetical protein
MAQTHQSPAMRQQRSAFGDARRRTAHTAGIRGWQAVGEGYGSRSIDFISLEIQGRQFSRSPSDAIQASQRDSHSAFAGLLLT